MSAQKFEFTQKEKQTFFVLMGLGVLGVILAFFFGGGDQASRLWSNLLLDGYYFMGISLCGVAFIAMHQLGLSGWHNIIRRVPESFGAFVPVAGVVLAIIVLGIIPGNGIHNLYAHWTQHEMHGTKALLLNKFTWPALCLFFIVLWIVIQHLVRKVSNAEDTAAPLSMYKKSKNISALFILVFAVTTSVGSWLFVMSIDPHWYSTLFGWYNFASYMCGSLSFLILILIYLKSRGYFPDLNENHFHDIGKYLFGFSVFWCYLWFSQFMLIWYSNIPEDTQWFLKRSANQPYATLMYVNVIVNFLFPLLLLMTRGAKRNLSIMGFAAVVLIMGHWLDFYIMIMPEPNAIVVHDEHHGESHEEHHGYLNQGSQALFAQAHSATDASHAEEAVNNEHSEEAVVPNHEDHSNATDANENHSEMTAAGHTEADMHDEHGHAEEAPTTYAGLGLIELLIFLGFVGGFLFTVFSALEKVNLVPLRNPYIKESIDHHVL